MSRTAAKLSDVSTLKTGKLNSNAAVLGGAYPFFTCSKETFQIDKFTFDTEAVLLAGNNANGIFPLKYYKGQFNAYQRTYVIETKDPEVLSTRYLYFALRPALKHFESASIGAATQYLTKGILDNFVIHLPGIFEQERIASILATYDDLIENNRRRITLLEDAARLLYREWFVHFRFPGHEHVMIINGVPEGWEIVPLGDRVEIKKGRNITRKDVNFGRVPVVAGGLKPAYFHDTPNVKGPVITVSASGANAGHVGIYFTDIWASDCSFISSATNPRLHFIHQLLLQNAPQIRAMQKGAAQPHVYPKDLQRLPAIWPSDSLLNDFTEYLQPIYEQIERLEAQSLRLEEARDLLLPRLMDGRLEI